MLRLDDLQVFVRTADRGSLSAAAREIGISPALASAAVKRLEGELGLRLLARTTRSLSLTAEGTQYLEHAREALRLLRAGHDALLAGKDSFGGTLKIAMPSDLGRNLMLGWLDEFQSRHPKLHYQLSVSDRWPTWCASKSTCHPLWPAGRFEHGRHAVAPATTGCWWRRPPTARIRPLLRWKTCRAHCLRFALEDAARPLAFYRLPQREQVTIP